MFKGRYILPVCIALVLISAPVQADNTLTINDAYAEVLESNPQIRGAVARIKSAEGNRMQQSLRPNPEAVFEAENFGGDDARAGFDGAEYTFGLQQQFEIAGKRGKRETVALHETEQARQRESMQWERKFTPCTRPASMPPTLTATPRAFGMNGSWKYRIARN